MLSWALKGQSTRAGGERQNTSQAMGIKIYSDSFDYYVTPEPRTSGKFLLKEINSKKNKTKEQKNIKKSWMSVPALPFFQLNNAV